MSTKEAEWGWIISSSYPFSKPRLNGWNFSPIQPQHIHPTCPDIRTVAWYQNFPNKIFCLKLLTLFTKRNPTFLELLFFWRRLGQWTLGQMSSVQCSSYRVPTIRENLPTFPGAHGFLILTQGHVYSLQNPDYLHSVHISYIQWTYELQKSCVSFDEECTWFE